MSLTHNYFNMQISYQAPWSELSFFVKSGRCQLEEDGSRILCSCEFAPENMWYSHWASPVSA